MPDRPREAPAAGSRAPAPRPPGGRRPRPAGCPRRHRPDRPRPGGRCAPDAPGSGGCGRCAAPAGADRPHRTGPRHRRRCGPAAPWAETVIRFRSAGCRAIGRLDHGRALRRGGPRPARRRCARTRRAAIAAPSRRWARSVLATTMSPEVSRSSRCTMPGPALGAAGQRRAAGDQRVDQGVVPVARRGVDHQPGGLVDDGEVLVLVDDGERDGGGAERAGRLVLGEPDGDQLAAGEDPGGAGGLAVDGHRLVGDEPGGLGAGEAELVGEEAVEALGLRGDDGELDACLRLASRHRGRLRLRASGVLPPHRDRQGDGAAAHGDVGHVERRPAERADARRRGSPPRRARCGSGRSGCRRRRRPPARGPAAGTSRPAGWSATSGGARTPRRPRRRRRSSGSRAPGAARTRRPGCRPGGAGTSRPAPRCPASGAAWPRRSSW